jgi:hypothetical protein
VTGAEKDDIVGLEFLEDIGLGVVVEGVIGCLGGLWNKNKNRYENS